MLGRLPVCIGICPPDTPAKKSWLQIGELWLYTSSSSIDKNLNHMKETTTTSLNFKSLKYKCGLCVVWECKVSLLRS